MKFPWVSRKAYELLEAELRELKAERQQLLAQVLELASRQATAAATEQQQTEQPRGRILMSSLRSLANDTAAAAAEGKGILWQKKAKNVNA